MDSLELLETQPPAPAMVEQMAVAQYHRIILYQNNNAASAWPNQYVSVNGYQVVLEREKEIVVADQIFSELNAASEGYEHQVANPNKPDEYITVRKRRGDLGYRPVKMGLTPQEADKLRRSSEVPVFPAKLTPRAQAALAALDADQKKGK